MKYEAEKIATKNIAKTIAKFGDSSSALLYSNIVEIQPLNRDPFLNNKHHTPYLWKKIIITSVSYYPKNLSGRVEEVDERHSPYVKSTVGENITIDFTKIKISTEYITFSEFYKEHEKAQIYNDIDDINKKIAYQTRLQYEYSRKLFLWHSYHETLPNNLLSDMNGEEFERLVEYVLTKIGYKTQRTKASGD